MTIVRLAALLLIVAACGGDAVSRDERARWNAHAGNVTITRDTWGIAHVSGRTDADAVFGMIYSQAEDDFNRIETNFINAMGRLAEAEGEAAMWRDLRMKMFINPDTLQALYARSPAWLQILMTAWADGLNFYLSQHRSVRPRVITRFEPWMALAFSEGSIGGDIEQIGLAGLQAFYGAAEGGAGVGGGEGGGGEGGGGEGGGGEGGGGEDGGDGGGSVAAAAAVALVGGQLAWGEHDDREPRGSNGIAIAPTNAENERALLLINPHTSFFFRAELQMTSDEGLNAYGAVTWGQFFVYQGFNERTGWMHTSSGADNIDEYALRITRGGGGITYRHGNDERPVTETRIDVPFRTDTGMASRTFTVYRTHLGPVVRAADGAWISVKLMEDPVNALTQSWLRTKARNHAEFRETMQLHTNSSNNTLYADADGTIAYYHANFVPRRDPRFDWRRPVDGSNPATDWLGVHTLDESPNVINPGSGWVYNANNWPWSAAGPGHSPRAADYPAYFEDGRSETPRGYHALRVLEGRTDFTIERLLAAAYDSYLPAFERQLPALIRAWDRLPASSPQRAALAEQIATLRAWDLRWGESSIATTLAVFWGEEVGRRVAGAARAAALAADDYVATRAADTTLIGALQWASDKLGDDFGSWQTPWGDVNRFQRLTGDIVQQFNDSAPSVPVPFTSARWGSLASFGARAYPGTKRWYGTSGNSFVAVVEFGDSVRAVAISAGGQSGNPASPHFNDQAERYAAGNLREVYFYPNALAQHTARVYRPGAR